MKRIKPLLLVAVSLISINGHLFAYDSVKLNDTGVDWCANKMELRLKCPQPNYPGQDAEFGRDAQAKAGKLKKVGAGQGGFDFTKLDKDGKPLPPEAKEWVCVRDNHTGLEWEVKTNDGGLRDSKHSYSWYASDPKRNGGASGQRDGGKCAGSECDTLAYVGVVNAGGLCGRKDWRLPSVMELSNILNYSTKYPIIDTGYFPNTASAFYWTTDVWPADASLAWMVNLQYGDTQLDYKADRPQKIRLVRGKSQSQNLHASGPKEEKAKQGNKKNDKPVIDKDEWAETWYRGKYDDPSRPQVCNPESLQATTPSERFIDHKDGTVTDQATGLIWMRCSLGMKWTGSTCAGATHRAEWDETLQFVKQLNDRGGFAGHTNWRLPDIKELNSIVERQCTHPSINKTIFPGTDYWYYWSSTPSVGTEPHEWARERYWGIDFTKGRARPAFFKQRRARLVRNPR